MRIDGTSAAGGSNANEDFYIVSPHIGIVLDGATARTETGCRHGVSWYTTHLGSQVHQRLLDGVPAQTALSDSIAGVTDSHRNTCDLEHPGTPSAAIGLVRIHGDSIEWLVLGDVLLVLETVAGLELVSDDHGHVAAAEQHEADRYPIGTLEKREAMLRMKHTELAARNTPGGFWVASTDPRAAEHAKRGKLAINQVGRVLMLSDGAARLVSDFGLAEWVEVLNLASDQGTSELIRLVREAEDSDPIGERWPRNKKSDDATAVLLSL